MDGLRSQSAAGGADTTAHRRDRLPVRAGGSALMLLASPLNARLLLALAEGPRNSERLREAVGSPPSPTMRGHLQTLTGRGLLHRHERGDAKGTIVYELAGPGQDLLQVGEALEAWLTTAPGRRHQLGSEETGAAIRALVQAWAVNVVRAVASHPFTLDDLAKLLKVLDRARLGRLLAAMREVGLLEEVAVPAGAGDEPHAPAYAPTPWLRRSVAPLAAGAAWERRHVPGATPPISRHDVENAFLLTVPLLHLRPERSGRCRLAVELHDSAGEPTPVGVVVDVREGEIAECGTRLGGAGSWALGTPRTWLAAVIEGDISGLQMAGDEDLATDLAWALHAELFSPTEPL